MACTLQTKRSEDNHHIIDSKLIAIVALSIIWLKLPWTNGLDRRDIDRPAHSLMMIALLLPHSHLTIDCS